jgi:Spy/CpxP family protein refolding chaperone
MIGKYKALIVITLIGVFALGVAAGYFGERYLMHVRAERRRQERPHFPSLDAMAAEVGMSAEQREKIGEIFRRNEERLKNFRGLMREKLQEIRGQLKNEIDAILTPEQQKKFETMIEKYLHPRGGERDRRPAGREPGPESKREPGPSPQRDPGKEPKGESR